jgi:hypothetical protein
MRSILNTACGMKRLHGRALNDHPLPDLPPAILHRAMNGHAGGVEVLAVAGPESRARLIR